jgi:NAD-dependent dihydropyrimidine dehydrogenase PreA subunit
MKLSYLKNVASLTYAAEKCVGCGKCVEVCPHGVFGLTGDKALLIQKDLCMECGACALNCPVNAISVSAGVGCASAIIKGWFTRSEPTCDCSGGECC